MFCIVVLRINNTRLQFCILLCLIFLRRAVIFYFFHLSYILDNAEGRRFFAYPATFSLDMNSAEASTWHYGSCDPHVLNLGYIVNICTDLAVMLFRPTI